ncbi:MAG: translation initiation factor IF-6 [Thaumarchaeota archaeon]|nr:translation initiation factor IF-6 [Nitrososphaerota archaeon]
MGIYRYDVYRSPNIGIFLKANDNFLFIPKGFADSKAEKLQSFLNVQCIRTSIAQTRLLGPLSVMNNNGILVPKITEDYEIQELKKATDMTVERTQMKPTALGNLIVANDKAGLASPIVPKESLKQIQDVLGVPVEHMSIDTYHQMGALVVSTKLGAAVYPKTSEQEMNIIKESLEVDVEAVTVNGGVPFVASGVIANSKSVVVGTLTTGPELIMLSRVFKV